MAAQRRACNSVVDPGEASSTTGFEDFLEMFGARHSSGDLFDLVWRGGGASGEGSNMEVQPTSFRLSSLPPVTLPPSEDDMAAWLYPIVIGQEPAVVDGHGDHHRPSDDLAGRDDDAPADHNRERPPNIEERRRSAAEDSAESNSCGSTSRKKASRGARRSHPAGTRNLAEKERRRKINEKLKTLQRLVPGCDDKSNQASTLEQTIRHIKSLQQQIQAMSSSSFGWRDGMEPPPAVYPVVPPPPPPYLPPGTTVAAAGGGRLPPAGLAPAVLAMAARGIVRPPPRSIRRWSLPSSGA